MNVILPLELAQELSIEGEPRGKGIRLSLGSLKERLKTASPELQEKVRAYLLEVVGLAPEVVINGE